MVRVFLKESVEVARPLEAIWGRFVGEPDWFSRFATEAEDYEARCGQVRPQRPTTRKFRVVLGPPHNRGMAIVVPLSWEASDLPDMSPVLDGEMEVASIDAGGCRITLSASYRQPSGEAGRPLDRLVLHGVASTTARAFLDRMADALEDNAAVIDLERRQA